MVFDLQEQHEIDVFKSHWRRYGKWVAGSLVCVAVAFMGYKGYRYYQEQQAQKAAVLYEKVMKYIPTAELEKIKPLVNTIEIDYPDTAYASRAALLAAAVAFDKKGASEGHAEATYTHTQLQWVVSHTDEPVLRTLARLRLANLRLDQKDYTGALSELAHEHDAAFEPLFLDLKGDIYVARGDTAKARDAWKSALAKMQEEPSKRQLVEMKLDSLGA